MGSKVTYTNDKYIWYGDSCVFDKTESGKLNDMVLRAPTTDDKGDGKLCKYTISFKTTCSGADACTDADRTVLVYTFEDRTPKKNYFTSLFGLINYLFLRIYFTPIFSSMAFLGAFDYMQKMMSTLALYLLPPAVKSNLFYINVDGQENENAYFYNSV